MLLTTEAYVVISNPLFFCENLYKENYSDYNCQVNQSFYHNSEIAKMTCIGQKSFFTVYSKTSTFIYLFLLFCFTLRSAAMVNNPLSKFNILYFGSIIGLLLMLVYMYPQWLQLASPGLGLVELGLCFGAAISVVCGCFLIRLALLHYRKGKNLESRHSVKAKKNEKIQLLKQFKFNKTLAFPLYKSENSEVIHI